MQARNANIWRCIVVGAVGFIASRSMSAAELARRPLPRHPAHHRGLGVDLGGHFLIPELPIGVTITTDCGVGDWPAAALSLPVTQVVAGSGPSGTIRLLVRHPDDALAPDTLYVLATITDNTSNTGANPDRVVLMFDENHNHLVDAAGSWIAANDRGIRFDRNQNVTRVYGSITTPTSDESATPFDNARRCIADAPGSWTIEAKLLPSDLGLNAFNALMGAASLVSDFNTGSAVNGRWPATATAVPNTWANLVTRQPIDYVLLVDQSGSMTGAKWTSAKTAADNFALVLSKVKDNIDAEYTAVGITGGGDRLGLANFTWLSGADQSTTIVPLASIPSSPGSFSSGLPANPGGATPIAGGINRTFVMFNGAPTFGGLPRTRVVVLMSDGMHNEPSTTINFVTQGVDLNYLPSPCGNNSLVRINTVAVGTDASVDVTKLNQIKNCFAGSTFLKPDGATVNTYNTADPAEGQLTAQLTKFFAQTVVPYYQWNTINSTGADFTINGGDRRVLLFAFWDNKGDAVDLTIKKPDMSTATGSHDATLGYSWLLFDNPASGSYTSFTAAGATAKYVFVDLRVRGDFAIDNTMHGTGGTILLRAKLQDRGQPVTGAEVRVDMARPGEGFGTYVSTHSLTDCVTRAPSLPPFRRDGLLAVPPTGAAANQPPSSDVQVPRFALISALFQKCGKSVLNRLSDPGMQLYDDGTHGDVSSGDGIYSLAMESTTYEGSYVFRFRASGHTADGQAFARTHEVADYVGVTVDPGTSGSGSRVLQISGNIVSREYWVIPRDKRGEYFGPGYPDKVNFLVTGGTKSGNVLDYNNGIYTQVVQYDQSQGEPTVTPVVNGTRIQSIGFRYAWELVLPFIGATRLDNNLKFDNGPVFGARVGFHILSPITLEVEGGVTPTKDPTGKSGNLFQALGNLRWDVVPLAIGRPSPHLTLGAGYAWFRGFTVDDAAALVQGGAGVTYPLTHSFGVRADARALRLSDVYTAGATTNYQFSGGLVWWF